MDLFEKCKVLLERIDNAQEKATRRKNSIKKKSGMKDKK